MANAYQPIRAGKGICGRWNDTCTCASRVLEYTCYYSTISPTTYALPAPSTTPFAGALPSAVAAPHTQGPTPPTQPDLPGPTAAAEEMRYSSPSSSSSPDTHDYNNIPTTCFYHTSLYQTSSPEKLVLTPVILAPTTPAAANKITKRSTEKKSAEMRSCAGARCTLFKHSSSLPTGMREWDVDALGGTTGWFLQRLIEVATTGNELPTVPSGGEVVGRRENKVGGMELDGDVDVDCVREQLERLKTVDAAERKDVQVVKAQAPGEEVLAMARTLENLTVSNGSLPPTTTTTSTAATSPSPSSTSTLSALPSNPFSALPSNPPSLPLLDRNPNLLATPTNQKSPPRSRKTILPFFSRALCPEIFTE
ncbi:hypothetical protein L211DRAFT_853953 [Terfezia boudieri ATCC MYA-4762]|uniref:Uncharacterized protein n=1 Tax=Terfezia boudieri ATCC MYA-4762 TaxID=1051890 RepID=A0A3N4L7P3_9PEZI|nr:hypothetical protein L211DRAFT_853953 [Terfezia boudieri ATCC MYA-4762]